MKAINPKVGMTRYLVEWCRRMPIDEFGDADRDNATYAREPYESESAAIARANDLIRNSLDYFGSVCVERQQVVISEDILQHENRRVLIWETQEICHVDGPSPEDVTPWGMPY